MDTGKPALAEVMNLAEKLNDSSIDRVMAIDGDWNIIAWNKTYETISGHLQQDVLGKNLLDIFPAIAEDCEMMSAIKSAFLGYKNFLPSSPGLFNRQYIENHFIPLKDEAGNIFGVMNIMHDVAHRIKAEAQLSRLHAALEKKYMQLDKANRDLATFTYIAGRDIKEPIKHVYTSLELLARKEGSSLSNTGRGNLRKMQASLNRMNLLLDDILAISRFSDYNVPFETTDLNAVLKNVTEAIADKLNAKSVTITTGALPTIQGSPEMLHYLFSQLIDNAIKFQPRDGQPVISIQCAAISAEDTKSEIGEYYEISFRDNGIGFESADTDRMFNMFERLHGNFYPGSGIGLAICKKIVEAHEGMISAESVPGAGSTLTCYFPTHTEE